MSLVEIELLHVPGCPNLDLARTRLDQAMAQAAVAAFIRETEVSSAEEAARAGMHGSPTILIDGTDPFGADDSPASMSCRLYRSDEGIGGAPTVAQLVDVLLTMTHHDQTTTCDDTGCCVPDGSLLQGGSQDLAHALAVAGFAALWNHRRLTPSELLPAEPAAATECARSLNTHGRAEIDPEGHLIGIHGLTMRSTRHHIDHHGRHHTWCAFDSIGIPAALGIDATAHTDCPTCGEPLTIEFRRGAPVTDSPVLWLPAAPTHNLLVEFCAAADLYCSIDHLNQRGDTRARRGRVSNLSDAAALGARTWADIVNVDVSSD